MIRRLRTQENTHCVQTRKLRAFGNTGENLNPNSNVEIKTPEVDSTTENRKNGRRRMCGSKRKFQVSYGESRLQDMQPIRGVISEYCFRRRNGCTFLT